MVCDVAMPGMGGPYDALPCCPLLLSSGMWWKSVAQVVDVRGRPGQRHLVCRCVLSRQGMLNRCWSDVGQERAWDAGLGHAGAVTWPSRDWPGEMAHAGLAGRPCSDPGAGSNLGPKDRSMLACVTR